MMIWGDDSHLGDHSMFHKLMSVSAIASTLVFLAPLPSHAADPGFCRAYATAALNQGRTGLALPRCRGLMEGSRWSADYRVHFDWCLTVPRGAADTERGVRTGFLTRCRL